MKLKFYFILFCLIASSHSFCQQNDPSVISSAGEFSTAGNITLEWTLGEPVIESVSASSLLVTQGFHQPILEVKPVTIVSTNSRYFFQVFPNPTTAFINIKLNNSVKEVLLVSLVDVGGRMLMNTTFPAETNLLKLDIRRFIQGTYFLRITNKFGGIHSEFKVIKAQ